MVTFEESRARKNNSRGKSDRRGSNGRSPRRSFGDNPRRGSRDEPRRLEFTKVTCDSCGKKCEVPFKPNSNKPIYCEACFSKDKTTTNKSKVSESDLDIINEKLNKIMKALKIQ